ncbi:hypothetical protein SCP_0104990 [Sparassis crispa]|uniref:Uncharacterized protein n=1 Tax=Sparassis crispa TaxID=139825 RepID=A0A401G630_9APHY|nr:hypothetical protein SCP_0104990 [Sparassis crispa]GBE77619.1 hypothetical protein SCP_0104990 [Sparassis crispa]
MLGPGVFSARAPALIIWTGLQAALLTFMWSQYRQPSLIQGPLPSHIPKAHLVSRQARFQAQPAHAA